MSLRGSWCCSHAVRLPPHLILTGKLWFLTSQSDKVWGCLAGAVATPCQHSTVEVIKSAGKWQELTLSTKITDQGDLSLLLLSHGRKQDYECRRCMNEQQQSVWSERKQLLNRENRWKLSVLRLPGSTLPSPTSVPPRVAARTAARALRSFQFPGKLSHRVA